MNSREEEARITALEADPDGIDWKQQAPKPEGKPQGPLNWLDAMLSLLTELAGFQELLARRVRMHSARGRMPDGKVDGHKAVTGALSEVLGELALERNRLLRAGLDRLAALGVARAELDPQFVGQNWAASSLTGAGVMDMRLRLWMRKSPATEVSLERQVRIAIPREGRCVRVVG